MPDIEQKIVLIFIIGFYLLLLLGGIFFFLKPPRKINSLYGYRTHRSMKNSQNWYFANKLAARYFILNAHLALIVSLLLFFLLKDQLTFTPLFLMVNFLYCFSLILIIPIVETRLKKFEQTQN